MSLKRIGIGIGVLVILVLAIAWIDGGEEPLHEISTRVPVPAAVSSPEGAL